MCCRSAGWTGRKELHRAEEARPTIHCAFPETLPLQGPFWARRNQIVSTSSEKQRMQWGRDTQQRMRTSIAVPTLASRFWRSINRHSNSSSFELLELAEEMGLTDCQLTTDYDLLLDDYTLKVINIHWPSHWLFITNSGSKRCCEGRHKSCLIITNK